MFSVDDPIVAPSRGTPQQALAYVRANGGVRLDDAKQYFDTLWQEAPKVGIDPTVPAGQFFDETDIGRSAYYRTNLNPAGIRITFPGEASHTWRNGREAALGDLHRLSLYANGEAPEEWERYDPHPENVGKAGYLGVAKRINDLSGRWAENKAYGPQIVGHLNRSGISSERTKEVAAAPPTKPTIHELSVDYAHYGLQKWQADVLISKCIPNRLGYQPQGIVWHIQDGSTRGSLSYWVGVQASSTVMINKDGTILNIIPRRHGPWTNGDSSNPSARGRHLISLGGGDANRVSLTCEMDGRPGDPLTAAQLNAAVWWALDVMREFPHIDLNDMYQHADINSVTRPRCPDGYYNGLLAAIRAASTAPPARPKPTITWTRGEVGVEQFKAVPVLKMVGQATILADTTSRYTASTKGKAWKSYKKGQKVTVVGTLDSRWAIVDAGDGAFPRVAMSRLTPKYPTPSDLQTDAAAKRAARAATKDVQETEETVVPPPDAAVEVEPLAD